MDHFGVAYSVHNTFLRTVSLDEGINACRISPTKVVAF
jgi:hypothetical protein